MPHCPPNHPLMHLPRSTRLTWCPSGLRECISILSTIRDMEKILARPKNLAVYMRPGWGYLVLECRMIFFFFWCCDCCRTTCSYFWAHLILLGGVPREQYHRALMTEVLGVTLSCLIWWKTARLSHVSIEVYRFAVDFWRCRVSGFMFGYIIKTLWQTVWNRSDLSCTSLCEDQKFSSIPQVDDVPSEIPL